MGSIVLALIQVSAARIFPEPRPMQSRGVRTDNGLGCQTPPLISGVEQGPDMAMILAFPQGPRGSNSIRSGSDTPAEIVFFPGVRYERWAEQTEPMQKKRARRRDKLELND